MNRSNYNFLRLLGFVYFCAFASIFTQWQGLYGVNGLLPVVDFVKIIRQQYLHGQIDWTAIMKFPSIIVFASEMKLTVDCVAAVIMVIGITSSSFVCSGTTNSILFLLMWFCYLSIYLTGQTFLSFQWDILLLETGFIAIFSTSPLAIRSFPNMSINWCFRFLAWKLMFLAGVVKLQAKCPTWENLTALEYHFASQCIPTPLSWWAHQLPPLILRIGVAATLLIEIPFTFLLISPFRVMRRIGASLQILLQVIILLTGNYNFFNLLTINLMIAVWADDYIDIPSTFDTYYKDIIQCNGNISIIRKVDNSVIGRNFQRLFVILIVFVSVYYMISFDIINPPINEDYSASSSIWERIHLSVAIPYDSMQLWFLPVCTAAICKQTNSTNTITPTPTDGNNNSNSKNRNRTNILSVASLILSLSGHLFLGMLSVCWILVSAGPLRGVCNNIDTILPAMSIQIEKSTQMFQISSGYGLFRSMTGVGQIDLNQVKSSVKKDMYSHRHSHGMRYGGLEASVVARPELVLEGLDRDSNVWKEIPFRYKPTDLKTSPLFIAPHQPRLDWQMWFAALGSYHRNPWLLQLVYKLLSNDSSEVIALLDEERYPFKDHPPVYIQAKLYDYDFTRLNTSWTLYNPHTELLAENPKQWWVRRNEREYLPPLDVNNPSLRAFLDANGLFKRKRMTINEQITSCKELNDVDNNSFLSSVRYMACDSLKLFENFNSVFISLLVIIVTISLRNIITNQTGDSQDQL
eukprot:gene1859-3605_t